LFAETDKVTIVDTITVGSPLSGTWIALPPAIFSKQARQMLPFSSFIREEIMEHVEKVHKDGVAKIVTRSYKNSSGERVWERIEIKTDGQKTGVQRSWNYKGEVVEYPFTEDKNGNKTLGKHTSFSPLNRENRARHFGTESDIVVSKSSAMSGKKGEDSQELDEVSGHLAQLTDEVAHWEVYKRIKSSIMLRDKSRAEKENAADS
jgi:hypothetical protein